MNKIRVLLIDDSVVVRNLLTRMMSDEPDLEVVATAANGRIGLARLRQCSPDVVIMDVEMPEMGGLSALREIRREWPWLPVIMFSSQTRRGAAVTLDALELGASDYIAKPAQVASATEAYQQIRNDLLPKVRVLAFRPAGRLAVPMPQAPPAAARPAREIDVVVIGTSTGGPNALAAVIPALPAGFPVPILIVQHMPPFFTAALAERLASRSAIPVREAAHGDRLEPGVAWIAPGDHHMAVRRSQPAAIELNQRPRENSCRPAVDVLLRSAADAYGGGVLAVVMTGMGQDGLLGCEAVHRAGGTIFVQDEETSVVWGMPGFVARAGLADRVLPLDLIAGAIVGRVGQRPAEPGIDQAESLLSC